MTLTHFQGHKRASIVGKWLVCTLSPEGINRFWPHLLIYIAGTCKNTDWILVTLITFSRSQEGLDCWKMVCLHPISWMNRWILTKLVQLYCWDMEKNWLEFDDLHPIFKIELRLKLLKNGFFAPYLLNEWMNFDQTCISKLLRHGKELIRFWRP